jgi:hypothetical protein
VVTVKYTLIAKRKILAPTFADSENNDDLNPNVSSTVSVTKTTYPNRLLQKCCGALVRMWHIASVSGLPGMAAIKG